MSTGIWLGPATDRKRSQSGRWLGVTALLMIIGTGLALAAPPRTGPAADAVARERLQRPELVGALLGALAYLEDTQVRDRPGKGHTAVDASDLGDGCRREISLNVPWRENLQLPVPPVVQARNRAGEWASHVHFLPKRIGIKGRAPVAVQDSNLFMTAFIAYPLFLLDDSALPPDRRPIDRMLPLADANIRSFKRGEAYNFWATLPGVDGKLVRSGPFNIPVELVRQLGRSFVDPKFEKFFAWLTRGLKAPPKFWIERCLDARENPTGADALFNIPNDADDTATAVAFQALYRARYGAERAPAPDLAALRAIAAFRDTGRDREDGRDHWKGKDSGAYLTWMMDERRPTFGDPAMGVIPLGVNNVDTVVNANVVFSLSMNRQTRLPGFAAAERVLARAVIERTWPESGLYYPQYMIFPYAVSRAWRDGGARGPELSSAMPVLLRQLLEAQDAWASQNPARAGAFPGGEDRSDHLSTALGLSALLNIGRSVANDAGLATRYDRAVAAAARYLVRVGRERKLQYESTRAVFPGRAARARAWESGLFFAASFWDLGHWRSEAFTVAMVAEALGKYALGYDHDRAPFAARRLRLLPQADAAFGVTLGL